MSIDFEAELKTLSHRYHVHHPFDKVLQSGSATKEMLQMWAANRYYYQETIPKKDALIVANCPDSDTRAEWCKHILTHDRDGALSEWLLLTRGLDLTDEEVKGGYHLLPGTKFACDAYLNFCRFAPWQEGMCSSMTHLFAGDIHKKRIDNWPSLYPWIPAEAFTYFKKRTTTLPGEVDYTLKVLTSHFASSKEGIDRAKQILVFKQDVLWTMMDALWIHFFQTKCRSKPLLPTYPSSSQSYRSPFLKVLGTAAGGGVPQWNRHDEWNVICREGEGVSRLQSSYAATADGKRWILFNASPDFGAQWNSLLREYPGSTLEGVVLTDAQLDHVTGLLSMREAETLHLFCTDSIFSSLKETGIPNVLSSYLSLHVHTLIPGSTTTFCDLTFTPHWIESRACKYSSLPSHVLYVTFPNPSDAKTHSILLCPCLPSLPPALLLDCAESTTVLMDGTFYDSREMPSVKGHVSVEETLSTFSRSFIPPPVFVHINNTNRCSPSLLASRDGMEFSLATR